MIEPLPGMTDGNLMTGTTMMTDDDGSIAVETETVQGPSEREELLEVRYRSLSSNGAGNERSWFQYRYLAFTVMLVLILCDTSARFGISVAMIGGMTKSNCSDDSDSGELCWSGGVKATLLGAYFYGYALQGFVTAITRHIGFTLVIRVALTLSILIQGTLPVCARTSSALTIALQVIRGLFGGVFLAHNMEFARKWGRGTEGTRFISLVGTVLFLGLGLGPMLAGLVIRQGWEWYFYLTSGMYALVLLLHVVFVPDNPAEARFMPASERREFQKEGQTSKEPSNDDRTTSLRLIFSRIYVWAFCLFMPCLIFVFYTCMSTLPFYLHDVLKASSATVGSIQLGLGAVGAFSTWFFAVLLERIDNRVPWVISRVVLYTITPMVIRAVVFGVLPLTVNPTVNMILLFICQFTIGTSFSGSIITLNYELDPRNAALIMAIFNGCGEAAGFINPALMSLMIPESATKLRDAWARFFFVNAAVAALSIAVVGVAYVVRRNEWRLHPSLEAAYRTRGIPSSGQDRGTRKEQEEVMAELTKTDDL